MHQQLGTQRGGGTHGTLKRSLKGIALYIRFFSRYRWASESDPELLSNDGIAISFKSQWKPPAV